MPEESVRRVVVGVSRSYAGLAALRQAAVLARERGAELHAVRTWRLNLSWTGPEMTQWRTDMVAETELEVRDAFNRAFGGIPDDLVIRLIIAEGEVRKALTQYADRKSDVLVVGESRHTSPWSTWWGVANYCRRHSSCELWVMPQPPMGAMGRTAPMTRSLCREADDYLRSFAPHRIP
jgi:nucleotide-binding universal stress UspA family protein